MKDSAPAVYLNARASFSFAGWGGEATRVTRGIFIICQIYIENMKLISAHHILFPN